MVVAINRFDSDTDAELAYIEQYCKENGADFALSEVFAKGGEGGMELARKVFAAAEQPSNFHPIYAVSYTHLDVYKRQLYYVSIAPCT